MEETQSMQTAETTTPATEAQGTESTEVQQNAATEQAGGVSDNRERAPASTNPDTPPSSEQSTQEGQQAQEPVADLLGAEEEEASTEEPSQDGESVTGAPEDGYKFEHVENGVQIDEHTLKEFGDVAKELNLSQAAAQKILSKLEPMLQRTMERHRAEWAQAAQTDEEFGGANFKESMRQANRAFRTMATPELQAILKASGLVNHPEVIRHFYRLSKRVSDGKFVTHGVSDGADGSDPRNFYKGMNP